MSVSSVGWNGIKLNISFHCQALWDLLGFAELKFRSAQSLFSAQFLASARDSLSSCHCLGPCGSCWCQVISGSFDFYQRRKKVAIIFAASSLLSSCCEHLEREIFTYGPEYWISPLRHKCLFIWLETLPHGILGKGSEKPRSEGLLQKGWFWKRAHSGTPSSRTAA